MARLVSTYPEWVQPAERVATSRQGRPVQLWCVSANGAGCSGGAEPPSVLYTALVHSREPATLMCAVHALRSLLRDARAREGSARHILSTRKLLWMPLANPDGYAWNERTRPRGGGMKRKNGARTCNPSNTENDGVDLNRNFGYKYAYDSVGSSARGCSEEYRGTGAFSEPETQAIRAVAARHKVKAILHWHGWGNDIAFPYSYDWRAPMPNDDLGMYQEFAAEMASSNRYAAGRAWESVGYTTNGEADDWGWGDAHAVSLTLEVGSSSDGFWPKPSRILPIAEENAWPAKYLAWAVGPMLQLDTVSVTPVADDAAAELRLTLQNNGLGAFAHALVVCMLSSQPVTRLLPSEGWTRETAPGDLIASKACLTVPALGARSYHTLPPITVSWDKSQKWIPFTLTSHPPDLSAAETASAAAAADALNEDETVTRAGRTLRSISGAERGATAGGMGAAGAGGRRGLFSAIEGVGTARQVVQEWGREGRVMDATPPANPERSLDTFRLRIFNSPSTMSGCDEKCVCASADSRRVDYSHECRQSIAPGSHCKVSKPAHSGSNWASGVVDETFHYTALSYSRGGRCTISSSKRDTLIAVYSVCSRFGAQSPVGFANSENGRTATVSWPCKAGETYYLFWNAEYMPGRFPFTVSEACSGGDCVRAHRARTMRMSRFKQRRERQQRAK
jgi:hypothetical protein